MLKHLEKMCLETKFPCIDIRDIRWATWRSTNSKIFIVYAFQHKIWFLFSVQTTTTTDYAIGEGKYIYKLPRKCSIQWICIKTPQKRTIHISAWDLWVCVCTVRDIQIGREHHNWDSRYICYFSTEMAKIWSPGTSCRDVWT